MISRFWTELIIRVFKLTFHLLRTIFIFLNSNQSSNQPGLDKKPHIPIFWTLQIWLPSNEYWWLPISNPRALSEFRKASKQFNIQIKKRKHPFKTLKFSFFWNFTINKILIFFPCFFPTFWSHCLPFFSSQHFSCQSPHSSVSLY